MHRSGRAVGEGAGRSRKTRSVALDIVGVILMSVAGCAARDRSPSSTTSVVRECPARHDWEQLWDRGATLTAEQVKELELEVGSGPDTASTHVQLLGYHSSVQDIASPSQGRALQELEWMIRRCAQAPVLERQKGLLWPFAAHPDAFERLGSLWPSVLGRSDPGSLSRSDPALDRDLEGCWRGDRRK
jgi:hypothetical protein